MDRTDDHSERDDTFAGSLWVFATQQKQLLTGSCCLEGFSRICWTVGFISKD